jgi:tetratricopeptide (TPR) repeat protein
MAVNHPSLARGDRYPAPIPPPPSDEGAALFARALDLQHSGHFAAAIALYEKILALAPELAEAHNNLGVGLAKLGRFAEAEAAYRRAIAIKADYPQACFNLGIALAAMRRFDVAEPMYRRAIALNPDFAAAYRNLGITLTGLGRLAEAEAACRAAIGLDPHDWEAHVTLGNALKSLGRPGDAEIMLRRSLALNPSNAQAYSSLGTVQQDLGKAGEAEASFRQAIAIRPDFAGAYNNLGLALKESGRIDEAREAAERAVALAPRRLSFYGNLAEVRRFVAGDDFFTKLEEIAREASSLAVEEQVHLHFALAKAYGDIGQHENAFGQLLAGNALKRRNVVYDEASLLAGLERVKKVFTPKLLRGLEGLGETSRIPIFVVGMARSGTTLIEQILASHPAVHGAGELRLFDRAAATIRNLMPGAPDYPDMVLSMEGAHIRALGTLYARELASSGPDAMHITDKMPSNFAFAGLIHLALPNAIIIHAVRDPLDTCVSCFSKHFIDGQLHTYDLAELGRYYRHYQALMAHWHRVLPQGRILDVSYEDTVADLEGAARRIIAHCRLPWDKRCLDFHLTERTVRTASATQVRKPIYKSAVGAWRRYEPFLAPLLKELRAG